MSTGVIICFSSAEPCRSPPATGARGGSALGVSRRRRGRRARISARSSSGGTAQSSTIRGSMFGTDRIRNNDTRPRLAGRRCLAHPGRRSQGIAAPAAGSLDRDAPDPCGRAAAAADPGSTDVRSRRRRRLSPPVPGRQGSQPRRRADDKADYVRRGAASAVSSRWPPVSCLVTLGVEADVIRLALHVPVGAPIVERAASP